MESKMKLIKELVDECIIHLKQLGYSDSYVERHTQRWSNGIIPYMEEHNLACYDPQIGEEYLQFASINMSSSSNIFRFRNIHMLDDFLETGDIRKKICARVKYPLPNEIGEIAEQFLIDLKSLRQSDLTISRHRRVLSYFITSLEIKFIVKVENIQEEDISDFIDAAQASKDHYYSTMKRFCRYLYANKITQRDLSYMINRSCLRTQNKLPSIYSIEEVQQIELSVEQSSYVGKRDYAILLLATRLGLRASDIANLTFSNLDWETNKIIFTQYKTGKDIELPLLTEVGEAIVNYLKYTRPKSEFSNIFFSVVAPYRKIDTKVVTSIISRIIRLSGVNTSNRRFGPHSMRHTLASRLLNNGVSLPVISETLGHSSTISTKEYLRVDIRNLLKCTINVPIVASEFYCQKGGVFYE